jgi:hypothetical protein
VGSTFLERDELLIQTSTSVQKLDIFCELVKQEVVVPLGEYQLFLHGDVFTSFPSLGGCEAALAVQDFVAFQHNLVREELFFSRCFVTWAP